MPADRVRVGADVGGTFTDVVTVVDGRLAVTKVPSTPTAPDDGVLDGFSEASAEQEIDPDQVDVITHGTTVATNAVLEGTWADATLLTTAGFRDVLEIGRGDRPALYDLTAEKPAPIAPRDRRIGVEERLDERGTVRTPLTDAEIDRVAGEIDERDVDAVAICLLFAFENDDHERALEAGLRDRGIDVPISRSSRIHPEIREYERTLVTTLNAALQPVVATYLERLSSRLRERGLGAPLTMMQSNGGTVTADRLRNRPVRGLLSGPAAGVQGAIHVAELVGEEELLTMDMGGTSCDVSLVTAGDPTISTEVTVGPYPVAVPMVDIHTIGAGGGSIARYDAGGALRVGPQSAGAEPGPICYGRGGSEPTVTDAHAILGRLDPQRFATGEPVGAETLRDRFEATVAEPMDTDVTAAAAGVLAVADEAMARAIRVVSVERGHDPRQFTLVAYGGAGPLHAPSIAATLDVPRVIVPPSAGVLSAFGLLVADRRYEYARSRVRPLGEVDVSSLQGTFDRFASRGREQLRDEGIGADRIELERLLDLRYLGQAYEVRVSAPAQLTTDALETIANRFHAAHERRYGHNAPDEPIELVTVRLRANGRVDPPALSHAGPATGAARAAKRGQRAAYFAGAWHDTPVYARSALPVEATIDGPALVEGTGSTLAIPPGQVAEIHDTGAIVVEVLP